MNPRARWLYHSDLQVFWVFWAFCHILLPKLYCFAPLSSKTLLSEIIATWCLWTWLPASSFLCNKSNKMRKGLFHEAEVKVEVWRRHIWSLEGKRRRWRQLQVTSLSMTLYLHSYYLYSNASQRSWKGSTMQGHGKCLCDDLESLCWMKDLAEVVGWCCVGCFYLLLLLLLRCSLDCCGASSSLVSGAQTHVHTGTLLHTLNALKDFSCLDCFCLWSVVVKIM